MLEKIPKTKILVLRFSSLGDIVLTSPVIRCLKKQIDNVEIHYCSKEKYQSILESNPYIDKTHFLGDCIHTLKKALKKEKFDYIIDLNNSFRSRLLTFALKVKTFRVDKLNIKKWLYVNLKLNKMPDGHIVDRYINTLQFFGVTNDGKGLDYFIPSKDEIKMAELPYAFRQGYVAFSIGGSTFTKRLPTQKIADLCNEIQRPIILLGGQEDIEVGEDILNIFRKIPRKNGQTKIYNACGKYNFNQSASVIKKAITVFSHDTGMMHIASAFKKIIYSIWGNTTPSLGMYPYNTEFVIFENKLVSCRPCSKIGFDNCPKGHFKCMNDLQFDLKKYPLPEIKPVPVSGQVVMDNFGT